MKIRFCLTWNVILLLAAACGIVGSTAYADAPLLFKTWADRAPQPWGERANQTYLDSIVVPQGFKQVDPATNLHPPSWERTATDRGFALFAVHPQEIVYPQTMPLPEQVGAPSRAFATPGEYVTLTFSVHALTPQEDVTVSLSAFTQASSGATLPMDHVDLRIVRCLHWPSADGQTYILMPRFMESLKAVGPQHLNAGTTTRFWLTVKLPSDTPAGIYHAQAIVKNRLGASAAQKLTLRVLPFTLAQPDPNTEMTFSILSNDNDPRLGTHGQGLYPQNMLKHFIDMAEHGLTSTGYFHVNPAVTSTDNGLKIDFDKPGDISVYSPDQVMAWYRQAGLTGPFEMQKGPVQWGKWLVPSTLGYPQGSANYKHAMGELITAMQQHQRQADWPNLIYVLGDEPGVHPDRLELTRQIGEVFKQVAPDAQTMNYFNGDSDFIQLKDCHTIYCTNRLDESRLASAQQAGYRQMWLYNVVGPSALTHRYAYGFNCWKLGVRGITQFIYQSSGEHLYNGFVSATPYMYSYPTEAGPLPTPNFEAMRQGIYDYRYIYTLNQIADELAERSDLEMQKLAKQARALIVSVMQPFSIHFQSTDVFKRNRAWKVINARSLDIDRWRLASMILKLQKAREGVQH